MSSGVDYPLGETIHFLFTTRSFSTGAPAQLGGTPVLSVYEDASTTQITSGVSLGVDHDTVTGLNLATVIATSGNGYESGKSYHVVITTGTVGGVSVVGEVVGHFTVERAAALRPTTAGNTLDVTATGAAGIDWGNVENATTSVDLSATSINLCDTVTTNTDMRGTDSALLASSAPTNFGDLAITVTTGQVTVGTNNDKTGYSISGTKTTLDALNDIAATAIVSGGAITTSAGAVSNVTTVATTTTNTDMRGTDNAALASALATAQTDLDTITGSDGVTLATAQALYAPSKAGDAMALTAAAVDAVWDETMTSHVTADSAAVALKDTLADTGELQTNQGNWLTVTGHATAAALATAQTDLDTITGSDGVTLATAQALYAPSKAGDAMALTAAAVDAVWDETMTAHVTADSAAVALKDTLADTADLQANQGNWLTVTGHATAAALATAQTDLDTLTGTDGATLATSQPNYAPATAAAVAALNDVSVADILTTQMTEAYNADGAAPTLAEALHLVIAYLTERSVSGTTVTAKKLDGTTTAATFTLNDGTTPTSVTRSG